jgi:hypothetical protein
VTAPAISSANLINHSGNCNFNLNGTTFNAANNLSVVSTNCIGKSSTGTITIVGDLIGSTGGNQGGIHVLSSTNGNTVVIGNVRAGTISQLSYGINQSAGNITVTGNVTGGTGSSVHGISLTGAASQFTINGDVRGGSASSAHGISFGGTLGTVNGNVTGGGGSDARGISTLTGGVNVTGNITAGTSTGTGINSTTAGIINVIGQLQATTTNNAVSSTSTTATNIFSGPFINSGSRNAIYCYNVELYDDVTTRYTIGVSGSANTITLFSPDQVTGVPSGSNVRAGVIYGPGNELTGSMIVPSPSDVRISVPTDNMFQYVPVVS